MPVGAARGILANVMQSRSRATAWVAIAALLVATVPAVADEAAPEARTSIAQRSDRDRDRHDRDRRRGGDALDAAAGFLGLFLGLVQGLGGQEQQAIPGAEPGCDPGAFYGWAQLRHPTFGYGLSYPSHWQQPQINEPNIVQAVVNPCPPNAAIIVARSDINRLLNQQELEAVMNAFQKEGGVFATVVSQEPLAAPAQTRRKGVFSGADSGVRLGVLVHLVSTTTGLFLVVGIVPDSAGEKTGTMLRYAIESFQPTQAFAPGG